MAYVESLVQRPELLQVDLFHSVSYTGDFMWPHRKNRTALNPAIVEAIQWGRLGLFISARNIGYGDHEPHLQNGVVRHHVETRGVDESPMTNVPIIRSILLAGRQGKRDPLGGVEEGKAQSNDRPQYLPTHGRHPKHGCFVSVNLYSTVRRGNRGYSTQRCRNRIQKLARR